MGHRQSPILNDNKLKLGFFSQEGRQFATRNADFLFCISVDLDQSKDARPIIPGRGA